MSNIRRGQSELTSVTELFDDGWKEKRDAVKWAYNTPVHLDTVRCLAAPVRRTRSTHKETEIELPVREGLADKFPLEVIALCNHTPGLLGTLVPEPVYGPCSLLDREE